MVPRSTPPAFLSSSVPERKRQFEADRAYLRGENEVLLETIRQTLRYQKESSNAVQTLRRMIARNNRFLELVLPNEHSDPTGA